MYRQKILKFPRKVGQRLFKIFKIKTQKKIESSEYLSPSLTNKTLVVKRKLAKYSKSGANFKSAGKDTFYNYNVGDIVNFKTIEYFELGRMIFIFGQNEHDEWMLILYRNIEVSPSEKFDSSFYKLPEFKNEDVLVVGKTGNNSKLMLDQIKYNYKEKHYEATDYLNQTYVFKLKNENAINEDENAINEENLCEVTDGKAIQEYKNLKYPRAKQELKQKSGKEEGFLQNEKNGYMEFVRPIIVLLIVLILGYIVYICLYTENVEEEPEEADEDDDFDEENPAPWRSSDTESTDLTNVPQDDPKNAEKEATERDESRDTKKESSTNAEKKEPEDTKPEDFEHAETENSKDTKAKNSAVLSSSDTESTDFIDALQEDSNDAEKENIDRSEADHTEKEASMNAEKKESEDTKLEDFQRAETENFKGKEANDPVKDIKQHIHSNNTAKKQKLTNTKKEDFNTLQNKDTNAEEKEDTNAEEKKDTKRSELTLK